MTRNPQFDKAGHHQPAVPESLSERQQKPIVGFPFHKYEPCLVEPCAIDMSGRSQPFHLLSCGHIVAVDDADDNRCGINCLHSETWVTQKLSQHSEEQVDIKPGLSLLQAVTNSKPYNPVLPPESLNQSHDRIFCEMCNGLPVSSYKLLNPETAWRRALALTRPVIEYYTGYASDHLTSILAPLFYNPTFQAFDWKNTHYLHCGHEVWSDPARPCAANCCDAPGCRGRIFPRNIKQGDAILCKECTYRAEKVYARYVSAGMGAAQEEVARNWLQYGVVQNGTC